MGDVEIDTCDFCKKQKPVERTYLKPSKHRRPEKDWEDLYNEGNYFIIVKTCGECGTPKV